jgi:hypothetical protein
VFGNGGFASDARHDLETHSRTGTADMALRRDEVSTPKRSSRRPYVWLKPVSVMVIAMAVIDVIAAAASASAEPGDTLTVEVVKFPTPVFGVRLAELDKGTPPSDMDITGPAENERDMDGGQASHIYRITPRSQPTTASAVYAVEQDGQLLGTFRINFFSNSVG